MSAGAGIQAPGGIVDVDMVSFVTLFLWLVTGVHSVQVAVDPSVATVDLYVDGRHVGVATEPDWEVECDFGDRLQPRELVAVAKDETGGELGRAVQVVNLPRPDAEVEVFFEAGTPDRPERLRVITESAERHPPLAIFVTLNGRALPRDHDGLFPLPAYDPKMTQIVSVEAHFPEGVTARRDLTFGGTYGSRVVTELTSVAVTSDNPEDLTVDRLQGLLQVRGRNLRVAAVEREGGRVYLVRDHRAWPDLQRAASAIDRRNPRSRMMRQNLRQMIRNPETFPDLPPSATRFFLVVPNPTPTRGLNLYPIMVPFVIEKWQLSWLASNISSAKASADGQRLAEATAVAGLEAASGGSPRIVVLVLDGRSRVAEVPSHHSPESVRAYLASLRVPLVVWSTGRMAAASWGPSREVVGAGSMIAASRDVLKQLRRQAVVWVQGRHLPSAIELAPNHLGVRLAGGERNSEIRIRDDERRDGVPFEVPVPQRADRLDSPHPGAEYE